MKILKIFFLLTTVLSISNLSAQSLHAPFENLLSNHVINEGVNYATLKSDEAQLNSYLTALGESVPSLDDKSNKAKAFWMNTYNAFTLKMVVENHTIRTVKELHNGNPWDVAWIELGGKKYSLNQIEKDILIMGFGDARVHFDINCAARSCPLLSSIAFTEENVESELERLTRSFVADEKFNRVRTGGSKVSKIFEWYNSDFGDVSDFLSKYSGVNDPGPLSYANYDWALNRSGSSGS